MATAAEAEAADPSSYTNGQHYVWAWVDDARGQLPSRMFAPGLGILEDEATGAAALRLTARHSVAMFRLLGGGVMGDMGEPLPESRLATLPATSHTAVITQADLLHAVIEPFLKGEAPKGMFEEEGARDQ